MQISSKAKIVINALADAGFSAYVVGGCVRDYFLGNQTSDTDITTSAKPCELEKILADKNIKVVETGLKHGTVTAVIDKTTFRDNNFQSGRRVQGQPSPSER